MVNRPRLARLTVALRNQQHTCAIGRRDRTAVADDDVVTQARDVSRRQRRSRGSDASAFSRKKLPRVVSRTATGLCGRQQGGALVVDIERVADGELGADDSADVVKGFYQRPGRPRFQANDLSGHDRFTLRDLHRRLVGSHAKVPGTSTSTSPSPGLIGSRRAARAVIAMFSAALPTRTQWSAPAPSAFGAAASEKVYSSPIARRLRGPCQSPPRGRPLRRSAEAPPGPATASDPRARTRQGRSAPCRGGDQAARASATGASRRPLAHVVAPVRASWSILRERPCWRKCRPRTSPALCTR